MLLSHFYYTFFSFVLSLIFNPEAKSWRNETAEKKITLSTYLHFRTYASISLSDPLQLSQASNFVRTCYRFLGTDTAKCIVNNFNTYTECADKKIHHLWQHSCLFKSILNDQFIEIFSNKKFHSHSAQTSQFGEWKKLKLKKLSMRRS